MKIIISGGNGFLGKKIINHFCEHTFYRFQYMQEEKIEYFIKKKLEKLNPDFFLYLAFIRDPKSSIVKTINEILPIKIIKYLKKKQGNCKFIYFSSMNVLLKNKYDFYSKKKEEVENLIKKHTNVYILRLPLILSNKIEGDKKKLKERLSFFKFINILPYKGSRISYIELNEFLFFLKEFFIKFDKKKKYFNLVSKKYIYLYQLSRKVVGQERYLIFPTDIFFKLFFRKVSPVLRGIDYEKNIVIKKDEVFQQKNIIFKS